MKRAVPASLAALFMLPASASATTQWFYNHAPIAQGKVVEVPASGPKVTVSLKPPGQTATKIPCPASGTEAFRNSATNGLDETRTITFSCPEGTRVTPVLPWTSTLLESELPLHDRWERVSLNVTYNGVNYGRFSGSLDTTVGDIDPLHERETTKKDEPDSYVTFRGGQTKALTGPNEYKLWLSGGYHLGGKGARVTDESGFWAQTVDVKNWPTAPYEALDPPEQIESESQLAPTGESETESTDGDD